MSEPAAPVPPTGAGAVPPQGPAFDPTQNVLNLVTAAIQRQDDLRESDAAHAKEMRETARMYEDRLDRKNEQIRQAETARIDAIRAVDVGAVAAAASVAEARANTLATTVSASAETLRTTVAAAATATAETLRTTVAPMLTRLDELSRAQYETQGQKQQVVETRDVRAGSQLSAGTIMGAISLALVLIFGVVGIFIATRGH